MWTVHFNKVEGLFKIMQIDIPYALVYSPSTNLGLSFPFRPVFMNGILLFFLET